MYARISVLYHEISGK